MTKVRKAVIPAAGLGTRFLPATKAMAKEMMPIVDTPSIQYVVEEAMAAGIEEIIIISGKGKSPIEDHFDVNIALEENLKEKGKTAMPWFRAFPGPLFGMVMKEKRLSMFANPCRTSAVASFEPSFTMMTSKSLTVWAAILSNVARIVPAQL